jgi:predicted MPP superfamily phosphohydrolase
MRSSAKAALSVALAGATGLAYSAGYEVRAFRLREATLPCLPAGRRSLRVLHLSDLHLMPTQHAKQRWVRELAALEPDLVVNTGDNVSHPDSVAPLMAALGDLRDVPGVFVFGSNDYWAPVLKSPLRYFLPNGGTKRFQGPSLPWRELRAAFRDVGWLDLSNRFGALTVAGTEISFAGVDDPHLNYDKLESVSRPADDAPGCTSQRDWVRRRTRRTASAAIPRPPFSR